MTDFSIPSLTAALQPLSDALWGWPTIALLVGTGVWVMLSLNFLPLRQLPGALWQLMGPAPHDPLAEGSISNRAALWTALAATVGTGNIAGVATAIALGGPGAVFWMWISGLLGIGLKFAETTLGVHYRVRAPEGHANRWLGGPMYYLHHGARLRPLAAIYALALAFAAVSIGGMVQSNSIADGMATTFGTSPLLVGGVVAVLAAVIMFGGLTRIARVANLLVPAMIALFLLVGGLILCLNLALVPGIFALIIEQAFAPAAAGGGVVGATVAAAMRYGLARGVFSSESGIGSAAVVAASARTRHPAEQGLIAMTQTFIDTLIICTFTALVILVSGAWLAPDVASGGAALTVRAFDAGLGFLSVSGYPVGGMVISLSLVLFAFTTILGWGFYGQQGAVYLFGTRAATPYLLLFVLCTFGGAAVLSLAPTVREGVAVVWLLADITVAGMLIPNLIALLLLTPKVRQLSRDWLQHRRTGQPLRHQPFHAEHPIKTSRPSQPQSQSQSQPNVAAKPAVAARNAPQPISAKGPQGQTAKPRGKGKKASPRRRK